jgi:hypothetical protein
MAGKYVKLGNVLNVKDKKTNELKKTIKLGQENSKDPKYNFTVDVRVTDANGKVTKLTNPWINLNNPHEKAPQSIVSELQVFLPEE